MNGKCGNLNPLIKETASAQHFSFFAFSKGTYGLDKQDGGQHCLSWTSAATSAVRFAGQRTDDQIGFGSFVSPEHRQSCQKTKTKSCTIY